jgi:hypothetical protein
MEKYFLVGISNAQPHSRMVATEHRFHGVGKGQSIYTLRLRKLVRFGPCSIQGPTFTLASSLRVFSARLLSVSSVFVSSPPNCIPTPPFAMLSKKLKASSDKVDAVWSLRSMVSRLKKQKKSDLDDFVVFGIDFGTT